MLSPPVRLQVGGSLGEPGGSGCRPARVGERDLGDATASPVTRLITPSGSTAFLAQQQEQHRECVWVGDGFQDHDGANQGWGGGQVARRWP